MWGVHGVGGMLGIFLLGVFASTAINPAGGDGLMHGNAPFFVKQVVAVLGCSAYAFVFTYVMLWLIDRITPVAWARRPRSGLDEAHAWRDRVRGSADRRGHGGAGPVTTLPNLPDRCARRSSSGRARACRFPLEVRARRPSMPFSAPPAWRAWARR